MLIKCPECGHQVSDKAPVCPGCGVEIAGHIQRCSHCGEHYLTLDPQCPYCHHTEAAEPITHHPSPTTPLGPKGRLPEQESPSPSLPPMGEPEGASSPKKGHSALLVSFVIAALICATLLYFYKDAVMQREAADYEIALKSKDTLLLQSFIDTYQNTNRAHVETIRQQLEAIKAEAAKQQDTAQTIVAVTPSDPIVEVKREEPQEPAEEPERPVLTQAETQNAFNAVRRFFIAINTNSREKLTDAVAPTLTSLNGKSGATKADVIQYMIDQYQADVKNLNWHLGNQTNITKTETADGSPAYRVDIPAKEVIERESTTAEIKYHVVATVNAEGKLSAINITRQN